MPAANRTNTALTLTACGLAAALGALMAQPSHREAFADAVVGPNDVSMVTLTNGQGGIENPYETLYVLDSDREMLFVYYIENVSYRRLDIRTAVPLSTLFREARPKS